MMQFSERKQCRKLLCKRTNEFISIYLFCLFKEIISYLLIYFSSSDSILHYSRLEIYDTRDQRFMLEKYFVNILLIGF
jgi:hypothetical protein